VVSDASTDSTSALAASAGAHVIEREAEAGSKASAMAMGASWANGEWLFFVDADCLGLTSSHLGRIATKTLHDGYDMSVGVFDYRAPAAALVQRVPWSTGERIVRKRVFDTTDTRLKRYNGEILINESIGRLEGTTASLVMKGVRQRSKVAKLGGLAGMRADFRMWREISRGLDGIDMDAYRAYMRRVELIDEHGEARRQSERVTDLNFEILRGLARALQVT